MTYSIPENLLERRRLLRLAREYRQKGYSVTLHPTSGDLPPALAKCSFDLIAVNRTGAIAAEIRTRESLTLNGAADLRRITSLVKQVPGWEFELVVTNPRKKAS
ncbi:MAG: hypothetical protein HC899_07565 [Leptolyngbyaceae cyanobacterium SM1_4_3]|nr:hypothetical protein [Leptolyngbyaceae cyanobacterium SM1_4_3]NJN91767.1 hypothetical protein [Leptolyngbyaceae cyanobacterium SL_5_14]